MESILCGVIAWNVIPRENISREGKHFIDLVFGKKMKVKIMLTYHEKNFEVLK